MSCTVYIVQTRRIMRQFFRKKSKILSIKREISLEMLVCIIRPKDGSLFAYQYNGLRTYHRTQSSGKTGEEILLNHSINDYASDESVQQAVENLGIEYVLMLESRARTLLETMVKFPLG